MTDADQMPVGRGAMRQMRSWQRRAHLMSNLYEFIWRFFESIHDRVVETWDWIVEKLRPLAWFVALFNLIGTLLLLVILLRACFQ